jgi:hypothetical protein
MRFPKTADPMMDMHSVDGAGHRKCGRDCGMVFSCKDPTIVPNRAFDKILLFSAGDLPNDAQPHDKRICPEQKFEEDGRENKTMRAESDDQSRRTLKCVESSTESKFIPSTPSVDDGRSENKTRRESNNIMKIKGD